jgi:hypothetical protein
MQRLMTTPIGNYKVSMNSIHRNVAVLMDLFAQIDLYWREMAQTCVHIRVSRLSIILDSHIHEVFSAVADTASEVTPVSILRQDRNLYEARVSRTRVLRG